ncbi:hypothetical protein [Brevundimonas sp. DC300-4]|uniref:hypothetical protein n=1 Tax=unclassified Brevundimonas TaxID=2622653 RepID=UPI003CE834F4
MTVDTRHARSPETWLWFDQALLDTGWVRSVRIGIHNELIGAIAIGAAAEPGDQVQATGLPGLTNRLSHVFQSGMAGLADECLVWRPAGLSVVRRGRGRSPLVSGSRHSYVRSDRRRPGAENAGVLPAPARTHSHCDGG